MVSVIDWRLKTVPVNRVCTDTSSWLQLRESNIFAPVFIFRITSSSVNINLTLDSTQGALLGFWEQESSRTEDRLRYPYSQDASMHGCRSIKIGDGKVYLDKNPGFVSSARPSLLIIERFIARGN
jgi:hypothetical protein